MFLFIKLIFEVPGGIKNWVLTSLSVNYRKHSKNAFISELNAAESENILKLKPTSDNVKSIKNICERYFFK